MTDAVVHLRCNATGKIRRENRDGRETIVLPSYAAKADTVLNDILYPRDELEASHAGLNRTPAPLGHPMVNGDYTPALDPEALARNHIFAWNENPRWDGDRIALDVVIDEARANECEGGRKVLGAINAEKPIATSTGLLCNLGDAIGDNHKAVARNIEWDHVAILLDEAPAISPADGVGIFVNGKKDENIKLITSSIDDQLDQEIEWAVESIARAMERKEEREENRPLLERIKSAIMKALGASEDAGTSEQNGDADMADEKQLEELSAKVNALSESAVTKEDVTNTINEALAPLIEAQNAAKEAAETAAKAEHDALVNKVVEAEIDGFTKEVAEKMDAAALNALLAVNAAKPKAAAPLMPGFMKNAEGTESFSPLAGVK